MKARLRFRLLLAMMLGLSMAVCVGLLLVRFVATGQFGFRFLLWNLFLAAIPFPFALVGDELSSRKHGFVATPFFAVWLLFLPNAPYLVTDILHVGPRGAPLWYDALLYGSFAFTGMVLCFGSLSLVHVAIRNRFGSVAGWAVALFSLALSGFGVYLGRIERWNSWSLWQSPRLLLHSITQPIKNPLGNARTIGFTVLFGIFLCIGYVTLIAIGAVMRELSSSTKRTIS
jgi:uncharacterized membrane protein